jgi:hypothetical protein
MMAKDNYNPYTRMPNVSPGSYGMTRKEKRLWGTAVAGAGIWMAYRWMVSHPASTGPSYLESQRNALSDLTVSQGDVFGITTKALETRPGVSKTVTVTRNRVLLTARFKDTRAAKQVSLRYSVTFRDGTTQEYPGDIIVRDVGEDVAETSFEFPTTFFDGIETGKRINTLHWTLETIGLDGSSGYTYLFNLAVEVVEG